MIEKYAAIHFAIHHCRQSWAMLRTSCQRFPYKWNGETVKSKASEQVTGKQLHGVAIACRKVAPTRTKVSAKVVGDRIPVENMIGHRNFRLRDKSTEFAEIEPLLVFTLADAVKCHNMVMMSECCGLVDDT
jgi:hypothetical protein